MTTDGEEMTRRALAAYFRSGGRDQPNQSQSGVEEYGGKPYVVLRGGRGVLDVYRIKPDGFLRRLRRWPKEVQTAPP